MGQLGQMRSARSEGSGPLRDTTFWVMNLTVSGAALATLTWLLLIREPPSGGGLTFMPTVNAALNATAAALLLAGYGAVRTGRTRLHRTLMVSAFAASTLFLVGYLSYHAMHGDTRFAGEGLIRPVYFTILISHILLSAVIVPGALAALYFAWRKRFETHKKITRWLLPAWLYVSVTGVVIFFMLHG